MHLSSSNWTKAILGKLIHRCRQLASHLWATRHRDPCFIADLKAPLKSRQITGRPAAMASTQAQSRSHESSDGSGQVAVPFWINQHVITH
jgi:hypothetical protein